MTLREQWRYSYRTMRVILRSNPQDHSALCDLDKMLFRAYCVLEYHRNRPRIWDTPIADRLAQNKIADEIISELLKEGR